SKSARSSGGQATRNSRSISLMATGSVMVVSGSGIVFQCLQALDHGFDAAARLLVARHQAGALAVELFLAVAQAAVFLVEPADGRQQPFDGGLEGGDFGGKRIGG